MLANLRRRRIASEGARSCFYSVIIIEYYYYYTINTIIIVIDSINTIIIITIIIIIILILTKCSLQEKTDSIRRGQIDSISARIYEAERNMSQAREHTNNYRYYSY